MKILIWIIISLVGLVLLVSFFYVEEDWRGKHAWENCKRQLQARGETLDWNDYIPPLVPDDQNFFKAPKMQEWFVENPDSNAHEFEMLFNDQKFIAILTSANHGSNLIDSPVTAKDFLAWSDQFEPDFYLIREALARPYARMDGNYSDPFGKPTPDVKNVELITLALAQRARSYLLLGQPQNALDELMLVDGICHIYEAPPSGKPMTLETAMLDSAVGDVFENAIAYGIQQRAWQEPQLIILQKQLDQINLSKYMQDAVREERAGLCYATLTKIVNKIDPNRSNLARGWFYQNLVTFSTWYQQVIDSINVSNNIVTPDAVMHVDSELNAVASSHIPIFIAHPYSFMTAILMPNLSHAVEVFACDQTLINETQIACALERYRLVHGEYPETLDALKPQFIQALPHDIIGGQPLHYRRTDDGKFLLYSVGWNETDDGGQASPRNQNGGIDYTNGDWVWPN